MGEIISTLARLKCKCRHIAEKRREKLRA